jgi:hypothetical protein
MELAHDEYLGSWPEQVSLTLFFYTRDKKNPNYFGPEALQDRYDEYDWKGAQRSDIPPPFPVFKGRNYDAGVKLYGDKMTKGQVVPQQSESFKWKASMSYTFAIHAIAFLAPLIKDKAEPMWVNLRKHQEYLMTLNQWSAKVKHILKLDLLIREHQAGFLAIWQFAPLYKYKLHAALHAAHNWLYKAPPRLAWCLKGENLMCMMLVFALIASHVVL